jgi:heme-degrading monooxygenase HmoA
VYARSSTFAAQRSSIDRGIAYLHNAVMPNMPEIDGWVGMSLMVDRATGRCIATTAWESEDALHESRMRVRSLRDGLAEALQGQVEHIEEWEVAVMHRDHLAGASACTRCTWIQVDPTAVDLAIHTFKSMLLPEFEKIEGFRSASLFVDRETGRGVGSTVWASREELDNSRPLVDRMRAEATRTMGAEVLEVAEFRLGFAHLRVPELV